MIAWILWFFMALHLFLLTGWLSTWHPMMPDFGLALSLYLALFARSSALPGLLFCAALSRSVLMEGNLSMHILVLGIPIAVLLPMRRVFSGRSGLWQCLVAGFLAISQPRLSAWLFQLTDQGVLGEGVTALDIVLAMCMLPLAAWGLRSLPPLSLFQEKLR